jgi:hypothetical protein
VGPAAIYRVFFAKLPLIIPGAHDVHFSNRLQPRDQHPATYIRTIFGPLFILGPRGAHFLRIARYACALSHLSNTCSYLLSYSDIVHFGYLVGLCAGPRSATLHVTPSGIYSALACSLSHGIAFTFQSHPLMIGLQDTHSRLDSTHTSICIL